MSINTTNQSISVIFLPATNSSPCRMRVRSKLMAKAITVHYPAKCEFDSSVPRECALYAAEQALEIINEGRTYPYKAVGVVEDYRGDRLVVIE